MMSKHIDLIAVGVLLLAFAFAARVHEAMHTSLGQARMLRIRAGSPIFIMPTTPHFPAVPRLPHLPRV